MLIRDKLTEDILASGYFKTLFAKYLLLDAQSIVTKDIIYDTYQEKELLDLLRFADLLSHSNNAIGRNMAYQIIAFLNSAHKENKFFKTVSKAVYSKLGNFPAINYIEVNDNNGAEIPIVRSIELESKKLIQKVPDTSDKIFTDVQFQLFQKIVNTVKYSFSGPTSMGKSFVIKAFIGQVLKNNPPENIAILVPTRALINQFVVDLKADLIQLLQKYRYKIVTNSNINDLLTEEKFNYIAVLTPERLISYISQVSNPSLGFLFVDEAHKLAQEKDSRSITTYSAIEKTINKFGGNLKLYFSSPNVTNPEVFLSLFGQPTDSNTFQTDESPVSQNLFFVDLDDKSIQIIQNGSFHQISISKDNQLFSSVSRVIQYFGHGTNNLIYNNSKAKTIAGAIEFAGDIAINPTIQKASVINAAKEIREYIHPDYYLPDLILKGVAYHHGKLPQLIRNLVEELYKDECITNVFCTSTLLEGVNMPTKNLFVLNNQNGTSDLEDIDFWNLTGRAGRLNKELFGNIFCLKHAGCRWDNKEAILLKKPINLKPTVISRIDRNIKKIEKLLNEQNISGTETEKKILKYIANIICIETLQVQSNYKSAVLQKLIENRKEKIIEIAKSITQNINVPLNILDSNQSIKVQIQQSIYTKLLTEHKLKKGITLPSSNSEHFYGVCKEVLEKFYDLYDWGNTEKRLKKKESMSYFAVIMNQWIKGFSLSQIIKQSISFHAENNRLIKVDYNELVPFDKGNMSHVNILIESIIDDIEFVLRFLFEKYFNHHHQILVSILGENDAGENWATLLEYGTQNRIVIALQNIGISRHTAIRIYERFSDALDIKDSKLVSVNKSLLLSKFGSDSMEFKELSLLL